MPELLLPGGAIPVVLTPGPPGQPGVVDDAAVATQVGAGPQTQAALNGAYVPFWKPTTPVPAGAVRMTALGLTITRNSAGTTRATYDATEAAQWTATSSTGGGPSYPGATLLVAASNSSAKARSAADYVCTGAADDTTINTALAALPAAGGVVLLTEGDFYLGNTGVQLLAGSTHLWGMGWRTTNLHVPAGMSPAQAIQVGNATTGNLYNNTVKRLGAVYDGYLPRRVKDAVITSGSPTLTSALAAFTAADNGKTIVGNGIPTGTTATYINATTVTLSATATATATGVQIGIIPPMTGHGIVASSNLFRVEDVYLGNIPQDAIQLLSQTTPLEFAEQSLLNVRGFAIGRDGVVATTDILDLNLMDVRMAGADGAGRHGFNLSGGYAHLVNCRANDFYLGDGVHLVGATLAQITGGHYDENGQLSAAAGNGHNGHGGAGIWADANTRAVITGAEFNNNDSYDVCFNSTSNSSIVGTSHDCTGPKGPLFAAIYLTGGNNNIIADANIVNPLTRGVEAAFQTGLTIHDCRISNSTNTPTQASIRLYAVDHSHVHHNAVANGISEENTSNNNMIEQNYLAGGTVATVGAQTVVVPFLTNPAGSQPYYPWTVAGLLGWSFDEAACASTGIAPSGLNVTVVRVPVPASITITNIVLNVLTAGAGLTAGTQNVGVIYDSAGNLLAQTGDQSTAWTTTGVKPMALTAPLAVTGGVGKFIDVGFLTGGTTLPQFARAAAGINSGPNLRAVRTSVANLTAPPATILVSTGTTSYWVGID